MHNTTEAQAKILRQMASAMAKMERTWERHPGYVVWVLRDGMPIPMSTAGPASETQAEAEQKAREFLAAPAFSQAWIITAKRWEEVMP